MTRPYRKPFQSPFRNQRILLNMSHRLLEVHDVPISIHLSHDRPARDAIVSFHLPIEGLSADVAPAIEETLKEMYEILLYEVSGAALEEE